jgi:hypothetical protein
MSIREFDFQKQRVRVRTTSCANAHVACDFGHHAILLDVKANFAKRGTRFNLKTLMGPALSWSWRSHQRGSSMPIWRIRAPCCAHAASGHAAAPPSAASNSRRPMVTVIRPSRARCVKGTISRRECAVPNSAAPGAGGAASRARRRRGSSLRLGPLPLRHDTPHGPVVMPTQ